VSDVKNKPKEEKKTSPQ